MTGRRRSFLIGALVAAVIAGVLPAAASAGTASLSGNTVTFVAGPGETNSLDTFVFDTDAIVQDDLPITAGPGCFVDPNDMREAVCPVSNPNVSFSAQLGDGSDFASVAAQPGSVNIVDGGPGNDEIRGDSGAGAVNTFNGGDGNDMILPDYGFERNPVAQDTISGGPGLDSVRFYFHFTGVSITLDGVANDGSPGEGDNVMGDVENLLGSDNGPDTLVGGPGPNMLIGTGADDSLSGGGGNDQLFGVSGNDQLDGGEGDDFLEGGPDDDRLDGGPGFDSFVGDLSAGSNQIITGNDNIMALDGVGNEPVSCGPGSDTVTADRSDIINTDPQNACEMVTLGDPPGGGGLPGVKVSGPKSVKLGDALKIKSKVATESEGVTATATGSVSLAAGKGRFRAKKIKLSSAKKTIEPGKSATLVQGLAGSKGAVAKAERTIAKALKKGQAAKAVITIKLATAAGTAKVKRTVQIK